MPVAAQIRRDRARRRRSLVLGTAYRIRELYADLRRARSTQPFSIRRCSSRVAPRSWRDMPGEIDPRDADRARIRRDDRSADRRDARGRCSRPRRLIVCDVADGEARDHVRFPAQRRWLWPAAGARSRARARRTGASSCCALQELGNYRNMALLGLPLAQRLTPEVSRARDAARRVDARRVRTRLRRTTRCSTN